MTEVEIRTLRGSDAEVIAAAFSAIGWSGKNVDLYHRYLDEEAAGHRRTWVAEIGRHFAGYLSLNFQPAYAVFRTTGIPEIQDLNVLPQLRRRGVGSALMQVAEEAARKEAASVGIAMGLGPEYGAAQRLYVRRGYIPDGRGVAYRCESLKYGDPVVIDDHLVLYLTKQFDAE